MQDRLPQYLMEAYIEGSIVPNARAILRFVEEQSQREKILSPSTTDVYTETDLINKSDETLLRTVVTTVKNMTGSSGQEVRKGEFSSSFDGRQFNISYDDATRFGVWYTEEDDEFSFTIEDVEAQKRADAISDCSVGGPIVDMPRIVHQYVVGLCKLYLQV